MPAFKSSRLSRVFELAAAFALASTLAVLASWWFFSRGESLAYGDAASHLNIARRITDSRTPGYSQIGTVWLPLPHLIVMPLAERDEWWRSGIAGVVPSTAAFVLSAVFLFTAARRAFSSAAAGFAALALYTMNPNLMYLQATPMTEPLMLMFLTALLYATVRFHQTQSMCAVAAAGLAALGGTLTRYEGWFLVPFATLYFLAASKRRRIVNAAVFGAVASLGPLYWLAHNWWIFGNAVEFYNGPYSAMAIYRRSLAGGMAHYPGDHNWRVALYYYGEAVRTVVGLPLITMGLAGILACVWKRVFWPLLLLALVPLFYVLSLYSSGTPIYLPHLWPHAYYNTRYAVAALPLAAFAAAGLAALTPRKIQVWTVVAVALLGNSAWLVKPRPEAWACWKEAQANWNTRHAAFDKAASFLRANYRPGSGIILTFADLADVPRRAGIPYREVLHEDNVIAWYAAAARPDLFLREQWAVTHSGDRIATAIVRASRRGPRYDCAGTITEKGAPVIEICERHP
jgi:hypothetical protein